MVQSNTIYHLKIHIETFFIIVIFITEDLKNAGLKGKWFQNKKKNYLGYLNITYNIIIFINWRDKFEQSDEFV